MQEYAERAAVQTVRASDLAVALEGKLRRLQAVHGEELHIIGPDGPNRLLTIDINKDLARGNICVTHGSWASGLAKNAQFDLHHPTPATVDDLKHLLAMVSYLA